MEQEKYEMVSHPAHYNQYPVECISAMVKVFGLKKTAHFCLLSAFKYRFRMGTKPGNSIEQDLAKEKYYLDKYHELINK